MCSNPGLAAFVIGFSILFFSSFLMKDGNIPDTLNEVIALKEAYDKNSELFFTDNEDSVALFLEDDCGNEDNFVYMPLKPYLKRMFKYESEIPNEWNVLHMSVSNNGTATITFS